MTTIASLIRDAAKTEEAFLAILGDLIRAGEVERLAEFLTKLNIPISVKTDDTLVEEPVIPPPEDQVVGTFEEEVTISDGIQKFLNRHMRKLKWHVVNPSATGLGNCMRLYRAIGIVSVIRVVRVSILMKSKTILTVDELDKARELLNKSYGAFREATSIVTGAWIEALIASGEIEDVAEALGDFPDRVGEYCQRLFDLREEVKNAYSKLSVKPDNYPAVTPPKYFGGDIMDNSSWRHFWGQISVTHDKMCKNLDL
jgi:hypothetical protein